jgi:hypothetical protein
MRSAILIIRYFYPRSVTPTFGAADRCITSDECHTVCSGATDRHPRGALGRRRCRRASRPGARAGSARSATHRFAAATKSTEAIEEERARDAGDRHGCAVAVTEHAELRGGDTEDFAKSEPSGSTIVKSSVRMN